MLAPMHRYALDMHGRGSVLFRQRYDMVCTSGFNGRRHVCTPWSEVGTQEGVYILKMTRRGQQGLDLVAYTQTDPPSGST